MAPIDVSIGLFLATPIGKQPDSPIEMNVGIQYIIMYVSFYAENRYIHFRKANDNSTEGLVIFRSFRRETPIFLPKIANNSIRSGCRGQQNHSLIYPAAIRCYNAMMLRIHPVDAAQIQRVAAPTPNNGIPLKRFYAAIATAKKINRKSPITCLAINHVPYPNLSQPCSVHRRMATKCIAYDRIGALEARTHATAHFWDDTNR